MDRVTRRRAILAFAASLSGRGAEIGVEGGSVRASFEGPPFADGAEPILEWIRRAAQAVAVFYGRFPVPRVDLRIESVEAARGIFGGTTFGEPSPHIRISVDRHIRREQLADDWMLTHEFVHLAFPSVRRNHHWIEEGLSTYVEPVARVEAGQLSVERYWYELARDVPQGLPRPGDEGLDHTHTWGRTYWGGALFCLVADLTMRERTGNRLGLQHALRGIVKAGGTIDQDWPIASAFEKGDAAAGTPVLLPLYEQWKDKPVDVDLPAMWRSLGVIWKGNTVAVDDSAPQAAIRRAMTEKPST